MQEKTRSLPTGDAAATEQLKDSVLQDFIQLETVFSETS
jgi:hypothetical protein